MSGHADRIIAALLEADEDEDFETSTVKDVTGLSAEGIYEILQMIESDYLDVGGTVKRTGHYYVHERTTDCYLEIQGFNWPDNYYQRIEGVLHKTDEMTQIESKIEDKIDELQKEIDEKMVDWNHKIYRELEAAYDDYTSETTVAETIQANDYDFDEDGNFDYDGGFKYDQLDDSAKEKARQWWVNSENESGDNFWSEGIILEWKWLLKNKGFDDVDIAYSGFASQGDGASFTAKSIDLKRYLTGPDPLTFPERERETFSESEDDATALLKDLVLPPEPGKWSVRFNYFDVRGKTMKWGYRQPSTSSDIGTADILYDGKLVAKKTWWRNEMGQKPNTELRRRGANLLRRFIALEKKRGQFIPADWDNAWNWVRSLGIEPEQLAESQDDPDLEVARDVFQPIQRPRKSIKHIETKSDYAEYERRVADFFAEEGITNLSAMTDEEGNAEEQAFSRTPCDCCRRSLGGTRIHASGYNPQTKEIKTYWICIDCENYAEYGQLDDTTMLDLKDDPEDIQERYAGAAQERGVWYHGTSAALIPKILSQGLIPEPKKRVWAEDPETSTVQTTRKSLPGIYVTTNLLTATGSALKAAQRDKASEALVVMELQPRSMIADEDTVNSSLKAIAGHLSGSAYHHIWPYLYEVYGEKYNRAQDPHSAQAAEKQKVGWVSHIATQLFAKLKKGTEVHPDLEKQVKELLFNEGYRAMLERNVAYIEGWDLHHYKSEWSKGFGEYGTEPSLPNPKEAEARWLAFSDKLARTLKDLARPIKLDWNFNTTGRVLTPIRFSGSNRIVCVIERIECQSAGLPQPHDSPLRQAAAETHQRLDPEHRPAGQAG